MKKENKEKLRVTADALRKKNYEMKKEFNLSQELQLNGNPLINERNTNKIKEFIKKLRESPSKIEKLKKEFWNLYTKEINENFKAFELMRKIGIAQGKVQKFDEIKQEAGENLI